MYNIRELLKDLNPEDLLEYLRKSRADDQQLSVEEVLSNHEAEIDEWVEYNLSGAIPEENRFREVVSGESIAERPEFQKVLKLAESPSVKAIIVKEVSRLGRPDTMEIGMISKTLRYTNTLVISVNPFRVFNLADKFERDMFENELKQGRFYYEYLRNIMGDGQYRSIMSGNYLGTHAPYGYDKITIVENKKKCPTLKINEEEANVVRMIFDWFVNENIGTQNIANRLNDLNIRTRNGHIWTAHAIRIILQNVHYIGMVRWNNKKTKLIVDNGVFRKTRPKAPKEEVIITQGKHEAIISSELFQAAQEKRGRSHKTTLGGKKELKNPLASLLFCECGRAMSYRKTTRVKYNNRPAVLVCNDQIHCGNGSVLASEMETFIADALREKIAEFEIEVKNVDKESSNLQDKLIKNLEKKISDLNAKEMSMWKRQVDPNAKKMPENVFQTMMEELVEERDKTEAALIKAQETIVTPIDYEEKIVTLKKALNALLDNTVSIEEKNHLMKQCIRRVDYHRDAPVRILGKGSNNQWTQPQVELNITWML